MQQPIRRQNNYKKPKQGLIRAFPNQYSSNASINAQLGTLGFYDLPAHYLTKYATQVNQINAEDVQQAVQKHLHPDRLTLVIVSDHLDRTALNKLLEQNLAAAAFAKPSAPPIQPTNAPNTPYIRSNQNENTIPAPMQEAVCARSFST